MTRATLLERLVEVSSAIFARDTSRAWEQRVARDGYFDVLTRFFLILAPDGTVAGWTGCRSALLAGSRCLYMDSSGVLPGYRGLGLVMSVQGSAMARELGLRPLRRLYVVYRSRAPRTYEGLRRRMGAGNVFPALEGPPPAAVVELGAAIHSWLDAGGRLEAATLCVRDAFGAVESLYGDSDPPPSGDAAADRFFAQHVGARDALLMIVRARASLVLRLAAARVMGRAR